MGRFEYVRDTGRACPSAFAFASKMPTHDSENAPISNENEKDEGQNMNSENMQDTAIFEPVQNTDWNDPEPMEETTTETIIKRFMSVKSFVTLSLTGVFAYLSIKGTISPEQFMSVFTMCISFFFGYSFEKKNNQK